LVDLGASVSAYSYRAANKGDTKLAGLDVECVADLPSALAGAYDAVVIANRTDQHVEVATEAARRGKAIYVEKPLACAMDGVGDLQRIAALQGVVVETGFMLRFHPNLRWLKQQVDSGGLGELMYLRAAVGQWLPAWRPDTDHRASYSARAASGGGVLFDLIHELDLVGWLAGAATEAVAMTRHVPALEIETEAVAQVGLRLESGVLAQVSLDYVRPSYGRSIEIVGKRCVLAWDYTSGTVTEWRADGSNAVVHRVPPQFERNTMFKEHMAHFLRRLSEADVPAASSLDDGVTALRLALACHRSAAERRCVDVREFDIH
jgi:predicted dehydrogenase